MTSMPSFDRLKWLAEHQPEALDKLQKKLCSEAIAASSEANRQQLRSLQHNLEQRLSLCSNPYHRCHLAMTIMLQKFAVLSTVLNDTQAYQKKNAKVLAFPAKQRAKN